VAFRRKQSARCGANEMYAEDMMTNTIYFIGPNDTVARIRNLFVQHKIAHLPVVENGKVIGMVSDREISDALYHIHDPIDAIPVSKVMRTKIAVVGPHDAPEAVAKAMLEKEIGEATVFNKEENNVLGLITKTDIIKYFAENYGGRTPVSGLMKTNVRTISRFHSIFHAAKVMEEHDIARLVVIDGGVIGIITARDLALATFGLRPEKLVFVSNEGARQVHFKPMIVDDLMRQELFTIPSKSDAASAARLMLDKGIGSVIVMDNNKLKGIITKTDLVRFLAEQA